MNINITDRINWWLALRRFSSLKYFCLFSGYPRSGHSLVGALMDAHPGMMISHELDVLEMVKQGFGYRHIFMKIARNSRDFAMNGRSWSGYSYAVPGQWQGRAEKLSILGDKRGGRTSLLLMNDYALIGRLQQILPVPIRIIHVVRNPFDNIVTRAMQGHDVQLEPTPERIREQIDLHFAQTELNQRLILDQDYTVHTIRHEELVLNPKEVLTDLCQFLEMEAPESWIDACANVVFESPRKTRSIYPFNSEEIGLIQNQINNYPFLKGYTFVD
jgi:hypothetical protein